VGFGFASGKSKKRQRSSVSVQVKEEGRKKVYINTLSQKKLHKLGTEEKKEIVIPLKKQNWGKEEDSKDRMEVEDRVDVEQVQKDRAQAKTTTKYGLNTSKRKDDKDESKPKRPMLLMNQVPGLNKYENDQDKFRHDANMRPEGPSILDYERIPVEDFGKAMLRGMGWQPGGKIGVGNNAKHVEPIQFLRRGYRQGLGADDNLVAMKNAKKKRFIRPGESRDLRVPERVRDENGRRRNYQKIGEKLIKSSTTLEPTALVEFVSGAHKGLFGVVEKMILKAGVGSCYVQLKVGGAVVKTANSYLKVLDKYNLPKNHPAFSTKSLKKPKSSTSAKKKAVKPVTWVRPNIRVRIISKSLGGGLYYTKKGTVYDVVSRYEFSVLMNKDRKLVERVIERNVETALPKAGGKVMIVLGEHKGRIGTLLERNSKLQKCLVQFDDDLETYQCGFEKLAEHVGQA